MYNNANWLFTNPKVFDKKTLVGLKLWEQTYKGDYVSVYEEVDEYKYMLKVVHVDNIDQFWTEVKYGQIPGIERSGVRVHAHTILSNGNGVYIMDHAAMGDPKVELTMTARVYANQPYFNPTKFTNMFKKTIVLFYHTVRGFHGDLHDENVLVNLDGHQKLVSIKIIDYANITPFNPSQRLPRSYNALLDRVQRDFRKMTYTEIDEYPKDTGIQVKWQKRIPVRSNKNMLTRLPQWKRTFVLDI